MDQLEEVSGDLVTVKSEQSIVLKTRDAKIVLTNPVREMDRSKNVFGHFISGI